MCYIFIIIYVSSFDISYLKLSKETEVIGEYIILYQRQKQSMSQELCNKDAFIDELRAAYAHAKEQLLGQEINNEQPKPNTELLHLCQNQISDTDNLSLTATNTSDLTHRYSNRVGDKRLSPSKFLSANGIDGNHRTIGNHGFAERNVDGVCSSNQQWVPAWVQAATSRGYYSKFSIVSL